MLPLLMLSKRPDNNSNYARLISLIICLLLTLVMAVPATHAELYGSSPVNNVTGADITFVWYATPNAPSYNLQVAKDINFTEMVYDKQSGLNFISISGFNDDGRTYYWRVIANDNGRTSATLSFVNGPTQSPETPVAIGPFADTHMGGKSGSFSWSHIYRAYNYDLKVATDIGFRNIIFSRHDIANNFIDASAFTNDNVPLPSDGSDIYWKVSAWNSLGSSGESSTLHFINDCNIASIGSGGGLTIDTCSDGYADIGMTAYLLKDISRRGTDQMQPKASIITGLAGIPGT